MFDRKHPIRWLYRVIFAVLFVILSSLLVASANGVMYNTQSHTFEQTGIIALGVDTRGATVSLDGRDVAFDRTQVRLANLFRGFHTIEVRKEGYFPWNKIDNVVPGQAIVHSDIKLFLARADLTVATPRQKNAFAEAMLAEPDDEIDVRGNEIWVRPVTSVYPLRTIGDAFVLVGRFSQAVSGVRWYPGKNQLLLQIGNEIRLIDRDGSNDSVLVTLLDDTPVDFTVVDDGSSLVYKRGTDYYSRQLK